ncbi:hypothetical protein CBR_g20042 [Chara braunii]|uniref:Nucleotide-diphospho-sugar transferase domain-containing protein n=1 Tax=Chara braunii TaxID=69332 RepID=A0A388KZJ8_CHABU|nr:hypothetical protein CBR_g20042 [Chara braunii]|eukprot:GBG75412.1 hypothetical protein CBR_g20042 [Chara braunii]
MIHWAYPSSVAVHPIDTPDPDHPIQRSGVVRVDDGRDEEHGVLNIVPVGHPGDGDRDTDEDKDQHKDDMWHPTLDLMQWEVQDRSRSAAVDSEGSSEVSDEDSPEGSAEDPVERSNWERLLTVKASNYGDASLPRVATAAQGGGRKVVPTTSDSSLSSGIENLANDHGQVERIPLATRPAAASASVTGQSPSKVEGRESKESGESGGPHHHTQLLLGPGGENASLTPILDENWREEEKVAVEGCTTPYALKPFLDRLAVNNTIVICTMNWGFRALFVNWLISVDKIGMSENVLVFAEDVVSWTFLENHWPGHAVLLCRSAPSGIPTSDSPAGAAAARSAEGTSSRTTGSRDIPRELGVQYWNSEGYGKVVRGRPFNILACLRHGYSVLYTDVDTVFMKNPIPFITGQTGGGGVGGGDGEGEMGEGRGTRTREEGGGGEGGGDGEGEMGEGRGTTRREEGGGGGSIVRESGESIHSSVARSLRAAAGGGGGGGRGGGREALGERERGGGECEGDMDAAGAWDGPLRDEMFNGFDCLPLASWWKDINICTYFMFYRPTRLSMHLMRQWIRRMWPTNGSSSGPARQNQPPFNDVLEDFRSFFEEKKMKKKKQKRGEGGEGGEGGAEEQLRFRFRVLPSKVFPSGHTIKFPEERSKWIRYGGGDPLVYHANYLLGLTEKRAGLQNNSLWFVNEAPDGTVEWPQLRGG